MRNKNLQLGFVSVIMAGAISLIVLTVGQTSRVTANADDESAVREALMAMFMLLMGWSGVSDTAFKR